ncbi:glycosyltransferase family 4 protein [Bacillus wiedmannii]|uniref:glycosyltransferase family 4 protein n=1 Tax=Bacillus wiedmannii TaxID=1890302 RepID=UPI000993EB46|nr:glycosyltransferase family 4 protein [Bacillus wiedmannii]MED2790588.1 glycosyltransferase family 4 protein [Bacillus wiedmannii]MED3316234.1 glycosyltransferase family 4 protein [Bacillus wiedmannii]MEE3944756.1 glycosyltransferase family 4 protein [Bacillus wiedmannii]OOR24091.1 glycosyl transferase family 1 [Bacillus wiedmannii]PFZ95258.1 glycosyltransferase family 4 protein [Bacillus wiedmannii]
MKIAIVHDWLVTYAGAEKVLEQMLEVFPEADLFSLVDFLDEKERGFIKNKEVSTTFVQKLPFAKKKYRNYLPLMPLAIEQLDLSKYDVILSSSHAVAKGVLTGPDQLHISYVHSPIRYAWDLQHQYLKEANLEKGLKGLLTKSILHKIRNWDYRTANGVDYFIGNSRFIGRRIWKVYRRESEVIYPPVDISAFTLHEQKEDFYMTASRMVPYKKIDLIVEAFAHMPDKKLIVIGDGPDFEKIKAKAKSNVQLLGYQSFEVLKSHMQRAKAFVFAAEEDFGITPVEAQACGTPVITYGKGGATETVLDLNYEKPTGLFFKEQTVESIVEKVNEFEKSYDKFIPSNCRENAIRFSPERFREEIRSIVEEKYKEKFLG